MTAGIPAMSRSAIAVTEAGMLSPGLVPAAAGSPRIQTQSASERRAPGGSRSVKRAPM
jgi:hypothetical protein